VWRILDIDKSRLLCGLVVDSYLKYRALLHADGPMKLEDRLTVCEDKDKVCDITSYTQSVRTSAHIKRGVNGMYM